MSAKSNGKKRANLRMEPPADLADSSIQYAAKLLGTSIRSLTVLCGESLTDVAEALRKKRHVKVTILPTAVLASPHAWLVYNTKKGSVVSLPTP